MKSQIESSQRYPKTPIPAVGAIVFKEGAVLLVKRGNPPSRGLWAIPGGSVLLGETLQEAAEREILEETGIVIHAKSPVFVFDAIEQDDCGEVKFHYVVVDLDADYIRGEPVASDDAADACWITEKELSLLPVNPVTRQLLFEQYQFGIETSKKREKHD